MTDSAMNQNKQKKRGRVLSLVVNIILIAVIVMIALLLFSSIATQRGYSFLGFRSYIVLTGSMSPAFDAGSYIIVKEKPADDIRVGDIVSYIVSDGETVLTHRVVEKNETDGELSFITRGDANNTDDERPVTEDRVLGTVSFSINHLGLWLLSLREPKNLIFCIGIFVILFFLPEVYRFITKDKEEDASGEAETVAGTIKSKEGTAEPKAEAVETIELKTEAVETAKT